MISGEAASTTNLGIAAFSSNDFTVTSGTVSLAAPATGGVVRGQFSEGAGIDISTAGVISHQDDSTATTVAAPTYANAGDITFVSGIGVDGFGHITSTPTTRRITDGDNICLLYTSPSPRD